MIGNSDISWPLALGLPYLFIVLGLQFWLFPDGLGGVAWFLWAGCVYAPMIILMWATWPKESD